MGELLRAAVVYTADDAFASALGISLMSLYECSKDLEEIRLYILSDNISKTNMERIESIADRYGRSKPIWIDAIDISRELNLPVQADRGSNVQYARIFIGRILEEKRILYVDADVMFRSSIRELWNFPLNGHIAAALLDAFSKQYRTEWELPPDAPVYNNGILVVDLDLWRKQEIEKKSLDVLRRRKGKIMKSDLGLLNLVLSTSTVKISPVWNAVTIFFDFDYDEMIYYRKPPSDFYSREEIEACVRDPKIVHFTSSFASYRPWQEGCEHPYAAEWRQYKQISPWADEPLQKPHMSLQARILTLLPRPVMLWTAALLQAYLRPFISLTGWRIRRRFTNG